MALFKPMVGTNKTALDTKTITEGYVWFTTGDGKFYIDWKDINDGNKLKRSVLNAGHADTATTATTARITSRTFDRDSSNALNLVTIYDTDKTTLRGLIGFHNTGGDGTGAAYIIPYPATTETWSGTEGLYIKKGELKIDNAIVLTSANYSSYTVTKTGSGASGNWGINVTGSSGSCTGNAATATKATQDASGNVITSTYATIATVNGKAPTSHASTATTYGAASASNYGHAMASSTTPKANGTAAVGSETAKFARGDHVHPLQTSVSGSAGSVAWSGVTSKPSYYDAKAIKGITRSGTTFTYTCMDGTTGTFTQQDTNTTYSFSNKAATLSWGTAVTVATVGGTDITVKLPANPNTDTNTSHAHTAGNGLTISGSGGTSGTTTYSLANSFTVTGTITAGSVVGAVWNDYAEYRETTEEIEAGRVVVENGDDTLSLSTKRLMPGANIVSDTFGFSIGETDTAKTPLAVSGRALAYPHEDRNIFKAGDPVCSGPNGTVSKMTREEVMMYPDRIIGTVSAIPEYETWGSGKVSVNGRIWIHIR